MSDSQYLVGIDLGTTNTVLAYSRIGEQQIRLFDIEQLLAPGEVGPRALLPSLRYHPAPGELPAGALQLPWPHSDVAGEVTGIEPVVTGVLARTLGAQVPGRLVASAKSWLSHASVDRLAPILPWGAAADVAKVSPVAASASYLAYLRAAWNAAFPQQPLERQQIVLTIPASFDEGARALTLSAARQAGLPQLRLLEEPQAAFYDWLHRHRGALRQELAHTRLILVCDVGGGTTDFSLIKVAVDDTGGEPDITRIGVGNHLILGGDNMDMALAHLVETRMAEPGAPRLSAGRLSQLMERCRAAKELLLAADAPESTNVTLLGAGSRLIGASRSVQLARDEVEQLVVDGFFPLAGADELPKRGRGGIVEFGLPYASDAAITRHLAGFLQQHGGAIPDTLLLNGGVFRADALAKRLADTLASWRGQPLRVLHNDNPDVAVARGGVAYALGRLKQAPAIGGGSPRSYFLILDDSDKARRAICILPRGSDSGHEIRLPERVFALRLGRPVRFHLASSSGATGIAPALGDIVELNDRDFVRLPPIATVLHEDGTTEKREIPVQLATSLSEVGTLEVHCVSLQENTSQRWLLEFQLRESAGAGEQSEDETPAMPRLPEAIAQIDRIFGGRAQKVTPREVRQLRQQLEQLLGGREQWHTPLLRQLFDALLERARGRRRSADHERAWLNLAGYCLRPGFGHALDAWRIDQLWALFDSGVQHRQDSQVNAEWWTLWRRVAGGLDTTRQLRLLDDFAFNLQADAQQRSQRPATLVKGSDDDMLRLGASLERIPGNYKAEIGAWLLARLEQSASKTDAADASSLWALARVGARQSFHGSAHEVVALDTVQQWLEVLLAMDWKRVEPAAFAAAHLARKTGDRSRDIDQVLRDSVIRRLAAIGAPAGWIGMVQQVVQLDQASEKRMLGEALPPGLKLIR
ncbi:putative chaperone protein, HscA/DnaK [Janthinobacterium agaricidamnosum NBRC 102515 = DSM 9628]|uniref:Putative chaperone protein, HscA/DnaK n=1 Tax=Janthinobacterium agaricidamnosum NBRC 102515 = DSM 9628 TaxID=1349767 RepID=W0V5E7_9BURK|nr:putative chaperone protein, HscA/DnaK [Janthinobacterium agaricidamnosum NBRC 102515 = DSM 9628]